MSRWIVAVALLATCASSATAAIGTRSVVAPSLRRMDRSKVANFVTEFTQSNGRVLKAPESSKLLWTQNEQYAVYTTAGLNKQPGSTPTFAAATWLNQPVMAEAFDVTGKNTFQFSSPNNQAEFDVATARHIDSQPVGDVDVAVAEWAPQTLECTLYGFASAGSRAGQGPIYTYTVQQCDSYLTGFDAPVVAISDDGSIVAYALASNSSTSGPSHPTPSGQLHVLNGQTGQLLFVYDLFSQGIALDELTVSITRRGEFIAFTNGVYTWVLVTATGKLRAPVVNKGFGGPVTICPMGTFLLYGFESAFVSKWNANASNYGVTQTFPGVDPSGQQWFAWTSVATVNGGGSQPDGCLCAFGWSNQQGTQARVDIYNMFTGKQYWSWYSWLDVGVQTVPELSFHMQYLAVATWGNSNSTSPTVLLFNTTSNNPLFSYASPGSMFDIDVLVDSAPIPPLDEYESYEAMPPMPVPAHPAATTDTVYLTAAGKHVPASIMGNGGDAFAWQFVIKR